MSVLLARSGLVLWSSRGFHGCNMSWTPAFHAHLNSVEQLGVYILQHTNMHIKMKL